MRPTSVCIATALIAIAQPACGQLIDFETYPGGAPIPGGAFITTEFASMGAAEFSTTEPGGAQILASSLAGQSGANTLIGNGGSEDPYQPIHVDFSVTLSAATVLALDIGVAGIIFEAFDGATLVDSFTVTGAGRGVGVGFVDLLSVSFAGGFDRLTVRQITPGLTGDGYAIDDLTFQVIPSPGAAGLLAMGAVASSRRRRPRAAAAR